MRILVADDHPLFRTALVQAVRKAYSDAELLESENYDQVTEQLTDPDIELAILDLNMPGLDGLLDLAELSKKHPDVAIVIISGHDDRHTVSKVKACGVSGFITKSSSMEQLTKAIQQVIELGEYWSIADVDIHAVAPDENWKIISEMTPQQKRVLSMIADGKLNKQIAYDLNIQETTIKQHVSAILKKLGVYNRTQAGLIYQQAIETGGRGPL